MSTRWAQEMGLRVPVVNAPMGGVAGGRLAAAVTAAGGLGMVGMGSTATPEALERALADLGDCDRFGIGLVDWVMRGEPDLLQVALDAAPVLLSVSFGTDLDWVAQAHERGVLTATQVPDVDGARWAAAGGIDVIVARGAEGGGHGAPEQALADLLGPVLAAVETPVLAAGGITTAADVRAALAAGAAGVWVGTAFAGATEALTPPEAKAAMVAAGPDSTVTTRAYDAAFGWDWPARYPSRVLRNDFTDDWGERPEEIARDAVGLERLDRAIQQGDVAYAPVDAGTGVTQVSDVVPAATIVERLTATA